MIQYVVVRLLKFSSVCLRVKSSDSNRWVENILYVVYQKERKSFVQFCVLSTTRVPRDKFINLSHRMARSHRDVNPSHFAYIYTFPTICRVPSTTAPKLRGSVVVCDEERS